MDRCLIMEKLDSLQRCLERVRSRCPATVEALRHDLDAQDIIALNLTRAVQICVDVAAHVISGLSVPPPDSMGESFVCLQSSGFLDEKTSLGMQKAVGFRNLAVHSYRAIDWEIVHRLCQQNLADFAHFAQAISKSFLNDAPPLRDS